jgi:hypothetical protein
LRVSSDTLMILGECRRVEGVEGNLRVLLGFDLSEIMFVLTFDTDVRVFVVL